MGHEQQESRRPYLADGFHALDEEQAAIKGKLEGMAEDDTTAAAHLSKLQGLVPVLKEPTLQSKLLHHAFFLSSLLVGLGAPAGQGPDEWC